ncbi:MAG TPA: polyprenol monophosphomannose synthase [Vicinamibacterales bacterium]
MPHRIAAAPTLSLVVPTYNERDRLPDLVTAIFDAYQRGGVEGDLVIVDDNSPDGTGRVADDLATRYPIRVVHRAGKLGLGTAVVQGFEVSEAQIVGVIDADLSHPPALVPRMVRTQLDTGADFVIGSRYIPGGGTGDWSFSRELMSRFACRLARGLTPVRDVTSGFFLVRRELARGVTISAGGFKICLELLIRSAPALVVEVPYVFQTRTAGESKMNLKEAAGYLRQLRDLRAYQRAHAVPRPEHRILPPSALSGI